jgi:hypothetical protein
MYDRISAGHFLSIAVSYPMILELFDADSMAGVKTLVHILRTCLVRILRGEGNSDTSSEPTPKKQIISLIHAVTAPSHLFHYLSCTRMCVTDAMMYVWRL